MCVHSFFFFPPKKKKKQQGKEGESKELYYLRKKYKKDKKSEQEFRDAQNNYLNKDITNEIKPENIFEGSILPKSFWRWLLSKQKHIWECIWKKT